MPWHRRSPSRKICSMCALNAGPRRSGMDQRADHRVVPLAQLLENHLHRLAITGLRLAWLPRSVGWSRRSWQRRPPPGRSSREAPRMMSTTFWMADASPTDVPPNFMMRSGFFTAFESRLFIGGFTSVPNRALRRGRFAGAVMGWEDRAADETGFRSDREYHALCF